MKKILRRLVSTNVLLYYLWFVLVRKQKGLTISFFQNNTEAYIDGYPRSGNTFLIHLVKQLIPELNIVHHLHAVAPIKIALLKKIPIFILVRDPMESISSKYLMHFAMRDLDVKKNIDENLLELFIEDYLNYYRFVLEKKNEISIIKFDELIKSPKTVLEEIHRKLKIRRDFTDEALSEAKASYSGTRNTLDSTVPNKKKEEYKAIVKGYIGNSSKYGNLVELYKSITKLS